METVAEENPLRSATSRIVTELGCWRLRNDAGSRRTFVADEADLADFDSGAAMDFLNFRLLLADTTAQ
jgi:hypothetical protein